MKYFRFGDRHIGLLTSANIVQCSYSYIWVPHSRKHRYSRWNFNSISSISWGMRIYFRFYSRHIWFWLPLTSHSVRIAVFEFLIIENMGIAVGILILSQLPPEICDSSGLSAAIFNLQLPVCQEAHICSARWDPCYRKSLDIRTVDFCPILVFEMTSKLFQTCHSFCK